MGMRIFILASSTICGCVYPAATPVNSGVDPSDESGKYTGDFNERYFPAPNALILPYPSTQGFPKDTGILDMPETNFQPNDMEALRSLMRSD